MRKIFTFLAAALMSVSMSAEMVYIQVSSTELPKYAQLPATIQAYGSWEGGVVDLHLQGAWWFPYDEDVWEASAEDTWNLSYMDGETKKVLAKVAEDVPAEFTFGDWWQDDPYQFVDKQIALYDYNGWYASSYKWIDAPEPAVEATVVFAANGKTTEKTVTLPHTFLANVEEENGELDLIIKELYEVSFAYCDFLNAPVVQGNTAVTAGVYDKDEENYGQYITISEVFEGTATVKGLYFVEIDLDEEDLNYELTISIKGDATAINNTAVSEKAIKRIVNGQLVIEKNGKFYNAVGAEVK